MAVALATRPAPGGSWMVDFARRHIGPSADEQQRMLEAIGYSTLDELTEAALPPSATAVPLDLPPALSETGAQAELRRIAGRNQVRTSMIGLGYYGTVTPAGDPPEPAGEPGLVHRVHAVPAGDLAGPAGDAAELPDHGVRPDRAAGGRRVAAGRGDRGGRGDDHGPPGDRPGPRLPGGCGLPAADHRGAGHPGRTARHRAGRHRGHPGPIAAPAEGELFGVLLQYPGRPGRSAT